MRELVGGYSSIVPFHEYDPTGTVMDPDLFTKGRYIMLPKDSDDHQIFCRFFGSVVDRIYVIPIHLRPSTVDITGLYYIINGVTAAYDGIVKLIVYKNFTSDSMQRAVTRLQKKLTEAIVGKSGIFARYIMGLRMPFSGRAIAATSLDLDPEKSEVGVPIGLMKKIDAKEGDIGLLLRNPVLHRDSIIGCRMIPVEGRCIKIHPAINNGLACDFDGDGLCIIRLPQNLHKRTKEELLYENYLDTHVLYINEFSEVNPPVDKSMKDQFIEMADSFHGRSLKLSDIQDSLYKDGVLNIEKFYAERTSVQSANIQLKIGMGSAGQLWLDTMNLLEINDTRASQVAKVCETISQTNLHSKHGRLINIFNICSAVRKLCADTKDETINLLMQAFSDSLTRKEVSTFCDLILTARQKDVKDGVGTIRPFCMAGGNPEEIYDLYASTNPASALGLFFTLVMINNSGCCPETLEFARVIDPEFAFFPELSEDVPPCFGKAWMPDLCVGCDYNAWPVSINGKNVFCRCLTEEFLAENGKTRGGAYEYKT